MANNNNTNQAPQKGEVIFSWQHQDYVVYQKDWRWYALSATLLVIAVAWTFWDANYLFGLFLIIFYLTVLLYENRPPEVVDFIVTPLGIRSGKRFYYWREIDHFYIVYKAEGIKNLYLEFKNPINGRLIIPLDGQDAVALRDYLLKYLREDLDREAEPLSEQLRRLLKL
jgi:hypothetical protein